MPQSAMELGIVLPDVMCLRCECIMQASDCLESIGMKKQGKIVAEIIGTTYECPKCARAVILDPQIFHSGNEMDGLGDDDFAFTVSEEEERNTHEFV